MILEGIHRYPKCSIVTEGGCGKGNSIPPPVSMVLEKTGTRIQDAEPAIDFFFGFRRDRVGRLGRNNVSKFKTLVFGKFPTGFGHDIGSLLLLIELAAIGDRRYGLKIANPNRAIVHRPKFLFKPIGLEGLGLEDLQKIRCLGKARTWGRCKPSIWVVDSQMPCSRTTHRKSPNGHTLWIDWILAHRMLEGFERIDFACEFVGVAIATKWMNHEHPCIWKRIGVFHSRREKLQLKSLLASTSTPNIGSSACSYIRLKNHAVGLYRSIELGSKTSNGDIGGVVDE